MFYDSLLMKYSRGALRHRLLEAPKHGRKLAVSLPQFSFYSGRPPLALSQATRVPEPFMRLRSAYRTFWEMAPIAHQKRTAYAMS